MTALAGLVALGFAASGESIKGLVEIASRVRRREIRLVTVDTQAPSPFSASLLFGYVANYLYEGDAPLAPARPDRPPACPAPQPCPVLRQVTNSTTDH